MSRSVGGEWFDAEAAARWVLEGTDAGWVEAGVAQAGASAAARVMALEAKVAALDDLLEAAREDGRAQGRADAAEELGAVLARIQGTRGALLNRAAEVALALAELFVEEAITMDVSCRERVYARALALRQGEAPTRVLVASGHVDAVRAAFSGDAPPIHEEPSLRVGDVVLEYADGRVDARVEALLLAAQDDVRDALAASR